MNKQNTNKNSPRTIEKQTISFKLITHLKISEIQTSTANSGDRDREKRTKKEREEYFGVRR